MTEIYTFAIAVIPVLVTSLIMLLAVIAPLTRTNWDNKALAGLRWFEATILKVLFPSLSSVASVKASKAEADKISVETARRNGLI